MIGLAGQYAAIDDNLTGLENLELVERFGLIQAGKRRASTYLGGMRRRLDLAASLVGNPQLLFLDEPLGGFGGWGEF